VHDARTSRRILSLLRDLGVNLSIDDFGTGFSSFAQLYGTSFGEFKLDKTFVQEANGNYSAATVVRNLIELGHQLGMKVVAEGIEDEGTLGWLCELGCDVGQGYLFSRPLPLENFLHWDENRKRIMA